MNAIWVRGSEACVGVLVCAGVTWLTLGQAWAVTTLIAGNVALIGYFLWHLDRLTRWATSDADVPVPEARGPWAIAFSALHRRVRSRTAHQRDLAHTIERMKSAVDAIPDGMVVLDGANRLRWANGRAQAHLGLDAVRDAGHPLANLVRQPEITRYLARADFSVAVTVESRRDQRVTLSIQGVPFGENERLLISRDISQVEAVERMRRDFIANVSHELKTPLTVVSGFAETLHDMDLDRASRQRYLELMQDQAQNMKRLVDDLLTL
ncbi:MAG: phosphate regulon sensor protein PhoR, partial [Pseudomonadota bacterium]|nr:phosphate regulon sensor protein PhoR [Pseudomonadota bacterium]